MPLSLSAAKIARILLLLASPLKPDSGVAGVTQGRVELFGIGFKDERGVVENQVHQHFWAAGPAEP